MKKTFHILAAAMLLTAGALLTTGCGNDDTAIDNGKDQPAQGRTVMFTATLAPMGDNGSQTRAITVDNQGTATETLNVAWKAGEEIAIYYQKTDGSSATVTATVGTPNPDGSAPFTATLTDAKGGEAKFVYPASLATADGELDESILLTRQNGLLRTGTTNISKNFDAATQTGKISVSGSTATVKGTVAMENRVCICKIQLNFSNDGSSVISNLSAGKTLNIFVGGRTYTISSPFQDEGGAAQVGGDPVYRAFKSGDVIYVAMLPVSSQNVTFTSVSSDSKTYRFITTGVNLTAGTFYRNIPLTLTQMSMANRTLTASDAIITLQNGDILTGTGGADTKLKIAAGATVTLCDVTNTGITANANIPGIECLGDATIILEGENCVTGRWNAAGIFVPAGKTLTIQVRGSGTLTATGGSAGAGIGGAENTSCGNIIIAGGTITATGTGYCAGIGSGEADGANVTCGDITISGGTVTATGGNLAAGIGSGCAGNNANKCGAITISGGTVTATGGDRGAGIGSGNAGDNTNTCGAITISGGTVEATGGNYAVGIGSGNANLARNNCGNITISGSAKVKAVGKTFAAGIGTGCGNDADKNCICGAISIAGGTVTATGGDHAAGIGSGHWGKFASISIGSDITSVIATRSNDSDNVPIGKGLNDQGSGQITFGTQDMCNYDEYRNPKWDWEQFPQNGQTYGGIKVAVTNTPFSVATWTLTPAP